MVVFLESYLPTQSGWFSTRQAARRNQRTSSNKKFSPSEPKWGSPSDFLTPPERSSKPGKGGGKSPGACEGRDEGTAGKELGVEPYWIWKFPEIGVPLIIHFNFNGIFPYKPTILGYPQFRKPPYQEQCSLEKTNDA